MTIVQAIKKALEVIFGNKAVVDALKAEVATLTDQNNALTLQITELKEQVANDDLDDAALEQAAADATAAAEAAKARADALQAQIDEAQAASDELVAAINDEPSLPSVDESGTVTDGDGSPADVTA